MVLCASLGLAFSVGASLHGNMVLTRVSTTLAPRARSSVSCMPAGAASNASCVAPGVGGDVVVVDAKDLVADLQTGGRGGATGPTTAMMWGPSPGSLPGVCNL